MGNDSANLPALKGETAREQVLAIEPSISSKEVLDALPEELTQFTLQRLVTSNTIEQPTLPGTRARTTLSVTYLKLISPNVRDKTFRGQTLVDGTVVGKTPFYKPDKKNVGGFPFIILGAWIERSYGRWNQADERMETFCESRDGVVPSVVNDWGALRCEECPHHPSNRPKYNDDPRQQDRCKSIYNLIGVGGDWRDFYVLSIKGKPIMSLYYKQIVPHIRTLTEDNLPWFASAFMLGTVKSGNYYEWEIRNILPTVALDQYPGETALFSFEDSGDPEAGPDLTFQVLEQLQVIANNYIQERQESARQALEKALDTSVQPVSAGSSDDDDNDAEGDDEVDDVADSLD